MPVGSCVYVESQSNRHTPKKSQVNESNNEPGKKTVTMSHCSKSDKPLLAEDVFLRFVIVVESFLSS